MKLTTCLQMILAVCAVAGTAAAQTPRPIQLHCDLSVSAANEKEMLKNYETIFKPAAMKQDGFIDLKLLKLRQAVVGKAPAGLNYRFNLTFKNEDLRQKWIKSDTHQRVWPAIENLLSSKDYACVLFDAL